MFWGAELMFRGGRPGGMRSKVKRAGGCGCLEGAVDFRVERSGLQSGSGETSGSEELWRDSGAANTRAVGRGAQSRLGEWP